MKRRLIAVFLPVILILVGLVSVTPAEAGQGATAGRDTSKETNRTVSTSLRSLGDAAPKIGREIDRDDSPDNVTAVSTEPASIGGAAPGPSREDGDRPGAAGALPNLSVLSAEVVDGSNQPIVPVTGEPFFVRVEYFYTDPICTSYAIHRTVNGASITSPEIDWGCGATGTTFWIHIWGTWTISNAGTYSATVSLDHFDAIAESNESDNTVTLQFTVVSSHGLGNGSFESFSFGPLHGQGGWLSDVGQIVAAPASSFGSRSASQQFDPSGDDFLTGNGFGRSYKQITSSRRFGRFTADVFLPVDEGEARSLTSGVITETGAIWVNTRVLFSAGGAIEVLQENANPNDTIGMFVPTSGNWAPGDVVTIEIETLPATLVRDTDQTLNVYADGQLIFTGHDVFQTLGFVSRGVANYTTVSHFGGGSSPIVFDNLEFDASALPCFADLRATDVSSTSAIVRWTTTDPGNPFVQYGPTPALGMSAQLVDNTTDHVVELQGLTPGTSYFVQATSFPAGGTACTTDVRRLFTTPPEGLTQLSFQFEVRGSISPFTLPDEPTHFADLTITNTGGSAVCNVLVQSVFWGGLITTMPGGDPTEVGNLSPGDSIVFENIATWRITSTTNSGPLPLGAHVSYQTTDSGSCPIFPPSPIADGNYYPTIRLAIPE